ncbi:unnamed protein product, partial [Closterium sp. Naga37s-1]
MAVDSASAGEATPPFPSAYSAQLPLPHAPAYPPDPRFAAHPGYQAPPPPYDSAAAAFPPPVPPYGSAPPLPPGEEAWRRRAMLSGGGAGGGAAGGLGAAAGGASASPRAAERSPSPPKSDGFAMPKNSGDGLTAAERMMMKMGWKAGQGLGKQEQGITTPLMAKKTDKHGGVIVAAKPLKKGGGGEGGENNAAGAGGKRAKLGGVALNGPPSKVVLLRNMVGPGEVDAELEEEVAGAEGTMYATEPEDLGCVIQAAIESSSACQGIMFLTTGEIQPGSMYETLLAQTVLLNDVQFSVLICNSDGSTTANVDQALLRINKARVKLVTTSNSLVRRESYNQAMQFYGLRWSTNSSSLGACWVPRKGVMFNIMFQSITERNIAIQVAKTYASKLK